MMESSLPLTIPKEEPLYLTIIKRNELRELLASVFLSLTNSAIDNKCADAGTTTDLSNALNMV